MNVLSIPLSILRFQYKIVRIPLHLFETSVVQTWSTDAPARIAYERTVGSLDKAVGSVLGDKDVEQRGEAQVHLSEELAKARKLEADADATQAVADQKLRASREAAEKERKAAALAADDAARNAREQAEQRKQQAAHEAEAKAAAEKKRADELAESRAAQARAAEKKQHEQIAKSEKAAAAPAESELADAAESKEEAEDKKAEAARIEKLFLAEKNS